MGEQRSLGQALEQHGLHLVPMGRFWNHNEEKKGEAPSRYLVHNAQGSGNAKTLKEKEIWEMILSLEITLQQEEPEQEGS